MPHTPVRTTIRDRARMLLAVPLADQPAPVEADHRRPKWSDRSPVMDAQRWFMLAVVVLIVAVIVYRRFLRTRERTEQDRRISAQAQGQAQLPGDRISQREDRRLAGMTAEDQDWEQASLQRDREAQQERARHTPTAEDRL
jgi:flagellar biosynthesis/type III secretory pathway M-ring protein FliF/YscJ